MAVYTFHTTHSGKLYDEYNNSDCLKMQNSFSGFRTDYYSGKTIGNSKSPYKKENNTNKICIIYLFFKKENNLNKYWNRPNVWINESPGDRFFIIISGNDIILRNSKITSIGKFIGYAQLPIINGRLRSLEKLQQSNSALVFKIDFFAGEYFIIYPNKKYAELIVNGSGRPIISWTKGIINLMKNSN